jgi:hypothetical protein
LSRSFGLPQHYSNTWEETEETPTIRGTKEKKKEKVDIIVTI